MGALCSGKSDNPHGMEPNRPNIKAGSSQQPLTSYALDNKTTVASLDKPASGLLLDDKSTKNISVEKHLGGHDQAPSSVPGVDEAKVKAEEEKRRQLEVAEAERLRLESLRKQEEEDRIRREREEAAERHRLETERLKKEEDLRNEQERIKREREEADRIRREEEAKE